MDRTQPSPQAPACRPESSKKKAVRFQDNNTPSSTADDAPRAELTKPAPSATASQLAKRKPAKRSPRHFVEEPLYMVPSHFVLLQDSTYELLRGLTNLSSAVENDPLYFDQLLGAAVNVKHAFDLGRIEVVNGLIRPRNTSLCHECITTVSSVWRSGPEGPRTLCNACGLRYYKQNQRRALEAKRRELRQATDSSAPQDAEDDSGAAGKRPAEGSLAGRAIAVAHRVGASSAEHLSSSLPNSAGHDLGYRNHFYDARASFAEDDEAEYDDEDDDIDSGINLGYFGLPASKQPNHNQAYLPPHAAHRLATSARESSPELTRPSIANLCDDIHSSAPEHNEDLDHKPTEAYLPYSDEPQFIPSIKNILAGTTSPASSTLPLPRAAASSSSSSYQQPLVDKSGYCYSNNVADIRFQEQRIHT
ncbi:hypothetical protein LPJ81_001850, partial [Coemansia sp. IMI 209127]